MILVAENLLVQIETWTVTWEREGGADLAFTFVQVQIALILSIKRYLVNKILTFTRS